MHSTSPGPTSVCCPSSVQLRTPSSPYIVSSKPSWLCAPGTLAPAATSNSKTATEPPDSSPSSLNRTAICPILISSDIEVSFRLSCCLYQHPTPRKGRMKRVVEAPAPRKRTSENTPSRDCLESPDGHQTGATQADIQ